MITNTDVLKALENVMDPDLGRDIVSLHMVRDIRIEGNRVSFKLVLTTPACPLRAQIEDDARKAILSLNGISEVFIETSSEVPSARRFTDKENILGVRNTVAVASGKGGVGKSTVAVNLAAALAKSGAKVGLLDLDIYGPSIPVMMGISEPIQMTSEGKMLPIMNYGIKMISVGFILEEDAPLIWRGPLVMQIVKQFLRDVDWGELDYLIIDLPPGTGDAQLTLAQTIPLTGAIIVTTPQDISLIDARRAIKMFEKVDVPVLGIVENMSYFLCPRCGEKTEIFSSGGGEKTSQKYDIPLIANIPIDTQIRLGGDEGKPIVISNPDSPQSKEFETVAGAVASMISILDMSK
ncbi:MAG: iron-sulfur cluster carrier protein ApbC [Nitrospinae bacterium]|nr:iron-sulfur cluster carrier protein ApbC [Nitrospinota bacterium]